VSLRDILRDRSLVVCVGPGGVGKTTVSAAIGLAAAKAGRRTLVLTIDPARRLADALGLPGLDDEIRRVPTEALPDAVGGELHAAMVDTAASYDALIRRIAPSDEIRDRVLENRVFKAISRSLARSHAYVAMERLYDATQSDDYDLVVLDTPPARNALEILDAPRQLARFLDARVVGWFLPSEAPRSFAARLFARGGEMARKMLGVVTGQKLLDEILEFLEVFAQMREGFASRAGHVEALLRGGETAFVLVSSASPASADDAAWLRDDLERRQVPIDAVVFNQSYLPLRYDDTTAIDTSLPSVDLDGVLARLSPHVADDPETRATLSELRALRAEAALDNERSGRIVDGVAAELPEGCVRVRAPRLDDEICDLHGLLRLVEFLTGR
jgi:anion-transporting  ArsA/GET3 family ATPase